MARWKPTDDIGKNEHIGRRLFDEPMLVGGEGQRPFKGLKVSHFEETRGREVSLERLGQTSIDPRVIRELEPLAHAAGLTFNPAKSFYGWAWITARKLKEPPRGPGMPVIASRVDDEGKENIYHAHVVVPDDMDNVVMACYLRYLFESFGRQYFISPDSRMQALKQWLLSYFGRFKWW